MQTFTDIRCFILADDVLLVATGKDMAGNFTAALNATHVYLNSMGAKVAPNKSFNFASHAKAKKWLEEEVWEKLAELSKLYLTFDTWEPTSRPATLRAAQP